MGDNSTTKVRARRSISLHAIASLSLTFGICAQEAARARQEVRYTVEARTAAAEGGVIPLSVALSVESPPARMVLAIPVWTPGSYRLRDFPERITAVEAVDAAGGALEVRQLDRATWQVRTGGVSTTVRYRVALHDDDRFMLRGAKRRCITYEGPAVYMYVRGLERLPCTVDFAIPDGWSVASGLRARTGGGFEAPDYDFLADCPVKLGEFQRFSFESHGKPIEVVVDGPGEIEFDSAPWLANIQRITDCEGGLFGGLPFERYVFLYTASADGSGGGLEHLTSTCIGVRANQLRQNAKAAMSTTAHEFFHTWNVKRLRPRELGPFDYSRPVRTTSLWLMEGVTSYYTHVVLARCGLEDEDGFWSAMAAQIRTLESNPAREHVSSADASDTVWDTTASDRSLNYYNSGLVLGLLLDVEIRARTGNARSLDDVMRALFAFCTEQGRGFDEHELVEIVDRTTGSDFGEFFDAHVHGTVVPPYERILAQAGVHVEADWTHRNQLRGARSRPRGDGVFFVDPDAESTDAVLRSQGAVVRVDGREVATLEEVAAIAAAKAVGERVPVEVDGPYGTRTLRAAVVAVPRVRLRLEVDDEASALECAIRRAITGSGAGDEPK